MMASEECEEKWVKHYSSYHRILLVGEGDFSFSSSLAKEFGSGSNIVATSLDTYDIVIKKYKKAKSNLGSLNKLDAFVIHGLDATKMRHHPYLRMQKFDRIIFNFPHAGFHGKETDKHVIDMHQKLMDGFFLNAMTMLRAEGEVHVSHKTTPPFSNWNIREIAARNYLDLIECNDFNKSDYSGYNQKRGEGPRCDEPFPLGLCSTFKFIFSTKAVKKLFQPIPQQLHRNVPPFVHHHAPVNAMMMPLPLRMNTATKQLLRFSGGNFQDLPERSGINHHSAVLPPPPLVGHFSNGWSYNVLEASKTTYLDMPGCQVRNGRTRIGDLYAFQELQRIETVRVAQLRRLQQEGEVHVSHKTTPPFSNWNIREIAARNFSNGWSYNVMLFMNFSV